MENKLICGNCNQDLTKTNNGIAVLFCVETQEKEEYALKWNDNRHIFVEPRYDNNRKYHRECESFSCPSCNDKLNHKKIVMYLDRQLKSLEHQFMDMAFIKENIDNQFEQTETEVRKDDKKVSLSKRNKEHLVEFTPKKDSDLICPQCRNDLKEVSMERKYHTIHNEYSSYCWHPKEECLVLDSCSTIGTGSVVLDEYRCGHCSSDVSEVVKTKFNDEDNFF